MSLKERIYSVMIVSASEKLNAFFAEAFPTHTYSPVNIVTNINAAKRAAAERDFDFIVINSPLPDDVGLRFAIDSASIQGTVVLFLARDEQYDEVYDRLAENGVFIIRKPVSKTVFTIAVGWLISARERLRKTEIKTLSIEEKMNEIRIVNRAKWLLISKRNMSEPEAHRYIEKQAMDRCVTRSVIAEELLNEK